MSNEESNSDLEENLVPEQAVLAVNSYYQNLEAVVSQVYNWDLWQQFQLSYNGPQKALPVIFGALIAMTAQVDSRAQDSISDAMMQNLMVQFTLSAISYIAKRQMDPTMDAKKAAALALEELALNNLLSGVTLLSLWSAPQFLGSQFSADHLIPALSIETMSQSNNATFILYPVIGPFVTGLAYFSTCIAEAYKQCSQSKPRELLAIENSEQASMTGEITDTSRKKLLQAFISGVTTSVSASLVYVASHDATTHFPSIRPLIAYIDSLPPEESATFQAAYESYPSAFFEATSGLGISNVFGDTGTNYYSGHSAFAGIALGALMRQRADTYDAASATQKKLMDIALVVLGALAIWTPIGRVISGSHSASAAFTGFLMGVAIGYHGKDLGKSLEQTMEQIATFCNESLCKNAGATASMGDPVASANRDNVTIAENPTLTNKSTVIEGCP